MTTHSFVFKMRKLTMTRILSRMYSLCLSLLN